MARDLRLMTGRDVRTSGDPMGAVNAIKDMSRFADRWGPAADTERLEAKRLKITVGQLRNRHDQAFDKCPHCGEQMSGHFVGHKDRIAAYDTCKVMARTDDFGWSGLLDMTDGTGRTLEQEYQAGRDHLQGYRMLSDVEMFGAGFDEWFIAERAKPETEPPHMIGKTEIPY